jgi:hypothetical protein
MARPLRIGFPGALYRVISKELGLGLVIQYLSRKWGHEYELIEAPDLALCHLARSLGIKSYGECIFVMVGESLQGHRLEW